MAKARSTASARRLLLDFDDWEFISAMGNIGITRTVAQEWARFWINVNAVAPGFTNTRLTQAKSPGDELGVPEPQRQATLQKIPMGRFGEPEDIANAVLFFAAEATGWVSGQVLSVDGGRS